MLHDLLIMSLNFLNSSYIQNLMFLLFSCSTCLFHCCFLQLSKIPKFSLFSTNYFFGIISLSKLQLVNDYSSIPWYSHMELFIISFNNLSISMSISTFCWLCPSYRLYIYDSTSLVFYSFYVLKSMVILFKVWIVML